MGWVFLFHEDRCTYPIHSQITTTDSDYLYLPQWVIWGWKFCSGPHREGLSIPALFLSRTQMRIIVKPKQILTKVNKVLVRTGTRILRWFILDSLFHYSFLTLPASSYSRIGQTEYNTFFSLIIPLCIEIMTQNSKCLRCIIQETWSAYLLYTRDNFRN